MPDETTNTNPTPSTSSGQVTPPEPTIVAQEPSVPVPTDTEPVEMPVEPIIAPTVDPTPSEVTNTAPAPDPVSGQNPAETGAIEATPPVAEIPVPVDLNTAHTTPQTPSTDSTSSGPAYAESYGEAKPNVAEGYVEAKQASEPLPPTEAELLAAEIAQRKLLKPSNRFMRWLKAKSVAARKLRAQKKSDKIIALFNQHEKITNELVRKNLHFPKQTAGNHLELLEKEGKIKQVGSDGPKVFYVKV